MAFFKKLLILILIAILALIALKITLKIVLPTLIWLLKLFITAVVLAGIGVAIVYLWRKLKSA